MKPPASGSVRKSKPALDLEIEVRFRVIRNERWVVLNNPLTGRFVRLQENLWYSIRCLDGQLSIQSWLQQHDEEFGREPLLEALYLLHRLGMLHGLPDSGSEGGKRMRFNPLMYRLPLFDPTRFLDWMLLHTQWLRQSHCFFFTIGVFLLAVALIVSDMQAIVAHWDHLLSVQWWWHYLLVYPAMKCLHELSHALVLRRLGGAVPEAGISLIVLMPLPYVDASQAWSLDDRTQRMLVTASGMLCDLVLAAIGVVLWFYLQPGVLADMAFAMMVLGVASVVFFNANPLLKFDGYYLLEDALDSPGLARRSLNYYQYLFKRYVMQLPDALMPVCASGERVLFAIYGVASVCYRYFIAVVITIFLIRQFREIGAVLSLFALTPLLVSPIISYCRFLLGSDELALTRMRAIASSVGFGLALTGFLWLVPFPSSTRTQGVVWVPDQAQVYAGEAGILASVLIDNGDRVKVGQALFKLYSPELEYELKRKRSALRQARLEHARFAFSQRGRAATVAVGIEHHLRELQEIEKRTDKLVVKSRVSGRIAFDRDAVKPGAQIDKGTLLSHVVDVRSLVVKTVVDQPAVGRMVNGIVNAKVRLSEAIRQPLDAVVNYHVPAGNNALPSAALVNAGYGGFDMERSEGLLKTRQQVFHLELGITPGQSVSNLEAAIGSRAYVTLRHKSEPIGRRLWRSARQQLIRHLSV